MPTHADRQPVSRYDGRRACLVGSIAPSPPAHSPVKTAVGRVPDPYSPGAYIVVAINRRVDILEIERHAKRISEAAYRIGRDIQHALEASMRSSSNWSDGVSGDPTTAREHRLASGRARAHATGALYRRIVRAVGMRGVHHINRVLRDGWSYRDIAEDEGLIEPGYGRKGERGIAKVAERFRQLLEDIAEYWTQSGRRAPATR